MKLPFAKHIGATWTIPLQALVFSGVQLGIFLIRITIGD
jgi:hypothetical protein